MIVNGKIIIADFIAEDCNGKTHVFKAKFSSGRLTKNQKASKEFKRGRNAHSNTSIKGGGTIKTSIKDKGFTELGQNKSTLADFHVLKYK